MKKSYDLYQIKAFNELYLIDKIKNSNIKIANFHKIDEYTYSFESNFYNRKKIKKYFPSAKLIYSKGIFSFLKFLIIEKITLISIIIASFFFIFLSTRVWDVKINGTYQEINASIIRQLEDFKIKKGAMKPNFKKLKEIENELYTNNEKQIEWIELTIKGSRLYVNYVKRRIAPEIKDTKGKLYASKDGIIAKINISKGNVLVKENQFVRKGDLLVDDRLLSSNNEDVYLGTSGEIYAYTWYIVETQYKTEVSDPVDMFEEAKNECLNKIYPEISTNEEIIKENILHYYVKDNIISIKIHFTLLEMIGEEV